MTSKEVLERLEDNGTDYLLPVRSFKIIKQDLEQLDELRKNHAKLLVQTADLEKENEFLETNIKAIETSNDRLVDKFLELEKIYLELVKEYTKREQAIEILKENLHISLVEEPIYPNCANYYINQYNKFGNGCLTIITKENFDLLKEVI